MSARPVVRAQASITASSWASCPSCVVADAKSETFLIQRCGGSATQAHRLAHVTQLRLSPAAQKPRWSSSSPAQISISTDANWLARPPTSCRRFSCGGRQARVAHAPGICRLKTVRANMKPVQKPKVAMHTDISRTATTTPIITIDSISRRLS